MDAPQIVVANTGAQIPPAEIERLFEPFQRLKTTRTNGQHGYGLGLSIVQSIANAHHAQLTAQPRAEGGLHIKVSFPATVATTPYAPTPRLSSDQPDRQNTTVTEHSAPTD